MPHCFSLSRKVGISTSDSYLFRLTDLSSYALPSDKVPEAMMLSMAQNVQTWRTTAPLLILGAFIALTLFLTFRPLRLESPASPTARALLRLDSALGATVEPIDKATATRLGLPQQRGLLVVTSVASRGPAAAADIRVGDVIEQIGGQPAVIAGKSAVQSDAATPVSIRREGRTAVRNIQLADTGA